MPRNLLLVLLVLAGPTSADPFGLRVRTTTPPTVATVAETLAHFLVPTGYHLVCSDPVLGDYRDLCSRPAPVRAEGQVLALRSFLPTLVPDTVALYVDSATLRLVIGPVTDATRFGAYPVPPLETSPALIAEPIERTPAAVAAPVERPVIKTPEPIIEAASIAPEAPEAVAPIATVARFKLQLRPGEALSMQLARQAPARYQIVWRARTDLLVAASAEIEGDTFEDTVVLALRALWRTKSPLRVSAYSNNVLVIESL
jgi:hypothetical protein